MKKSGFKMKGPSLYKNSPMRDEKKGKRITDAKGNLINVDVTSEYKRIGNKETRDAIAAGAKVVKNTETGNITVQKLTKKSATPRRMGLKHFTTAERIH